MGSYDDMLPIFKGSARTAAVLGIGTANPPCELDQSTLPEYYFRLTNSEHMVQLKEKFSRICANSMINRRYTYDTEAIVKENPSIALYGASSLDARQKLADVMIPTLGAQAATKAINDWGRSLSDITHLIVCNSSGASMPGADHEIIKMLGLPLSTKRFMLYHQGCFGGGSVLRLAKDLAENNEDSRILVVCSEPIINGFNGPCKDHIQNLVVQILFGDGAGAVIVGANPRPDIELPLFEIVWTSQNIIPGSDGLIEGKLRESGLMISVQPDQLPLYIARSMGEFVKEALGAAGINDVNDAFYIVHPGGRAILDAIEIALGLKKEKLSATREVLRDYGNMSSASVLFVMETMRRRSEEKRMGTAGDGLEWGLLIGFGPGITVETVVLRCP